MTKTKDKKGGYVRERMREAKAKRLAAEAENPVVTSADIEEAKRRATAEKLRRQRAGQWGGSAVAHESYQKRPEDWIVEYLGVPRETIRWSLNPEYKDHEWDGDPDPISRMLEALADGRDVGIESATGVGKTFIAACVVYWFLACHRDALVYTAAPREDQLLLGVWKEIGKLWPRFQEHFPSAELLNGKIRMATEDRGKETWAATAFVCGVGANEEAAVRAQGLHAEHMLIITEETPGIHPAIMNSFENTRTDDHNPQLALGNPDSQHDPLHQFCMQDHVENLRISALDHPNVVCGRSVVPGAIGARRLVERTQKYGKGSRLYESRVRGISPSEASNALIKWEWCVEASKKWGDKEYREGLPALGVDVANSEKGDEAAIARGIGACLLEVESFPCPNASELGVRVAFEAKRKENPVSPKHIGVDAVGVGAATVNKLAEEGLRVRKITSNAKAVPTMDEELRWSTVEEDDLDGTVSPTGAMVVEAEEFANQRAQAWWKLREDLRLGRVAFPYDEALFRDLTTPTFRTMNGKIIVEAKEEIVKRLKRSPNKGDAAVYWNFVRRRRPIKTVARRNLASDHLRDRGLERIDAAYRKKQRMQRHRRRVA